MIKILDIGTHKAEELKVLFNYGFERYIFYSIWWYNYLKYIIKILLGHQIFFKAYGYQKSPFELKFREHIDILINLIFFIHVSKKKYKIISIEPNILNLIVNSLNFIKKYDVELFSIAISLKKKNFHLSNFYKNKNSLSSSLIDKTKTNNKSILATIDFNTLLEKFLEKKILSKKDDFILRINCEGAEAQIIKSLIKKKIKPSLILGSLEDIKKIHGLRAYKQIENLLKKNKITYKYFKGTDPSTWNLAKSNFFNV